MRWLLLNEHILVEGSAAVGIAALRQQKVTVSGPIGVVVTGRNVAGATLSKVLLAQL
jgi:threonine dehydratase